MLILAVRDLGCLLLVWILCQKLSRDGSVSGAGDSLWLEGVVPCSSLLPRSPCPQVQPRVRAREGPSPWMSMGTGIEGFADVLLSASLVSLNRSSLKVT